MIDLVRWNALVSYAQAEQDKNRELKLQNQHYADVIGKLQAELKAQRTVLEAQIAGLQPGKGRHIESCETPSLFFRWIGSLWACGCGQVWRVDRHIHKFWVRQQ